MVPRQLVWISKTNSAPGHFGYGSYKQAGHIRSTVNTEKQENTGSGLFLSSFSVCGLVSVYITLNRGLPKFAHTSQTLCLAGLYHMPFCMDSSAKWHEGQLSCALFESQMIFSGPHLPAGFNSLWNSLCSPYRNDKSYPDHTILVSYIL